MDDCDVIKVIRALIPIVRPIKESIPDFPEGYCDVCTVQIQEQAALLYCDLKPMWGRVSGLKHFWVKIKGCNIDFTAGQFPCLANHLRNVDGFDVLYGSDCFLQSIGFTIEPMDKRSEDALEGAATSVLMNEFGDLTPR